MLIQVSIRREKLRRDYPFHDRAVCFAELENGSSGPRVVHESISKCGVIYGFPEVRLSTWRHPITGEGPDAVELPTGPPVFVLLPRLSGVASHSVRARF